MAQRWILMGGVVAAACCMVAAQAGAKDGATKAAPSMEAEQARIEQRNQEELKRQAQQLEQIRRENPQQYKQAKAVLDREAAIRKITTAYLRQEIDYAGASRQLAPLIRSKMKEELETVDGRIEYTKSMLAELQELKKTPEAWVKRQSDILLPPLDSSSDKPMTR